MFTGIIEAQGVLDTITPNGANLSFKISSPISSALRVDQSVSHDGICLTVEQLSETSHQVTAVAETISKTNLNKWLPGRRINLERCIQVGDRLDGHLVQGHVDATGKCESITEQKGSWLLQFSYPTAFQPMMIEKGSICVNGISLTCFNLQSNKFSVAIIPYTFEHTNLNQLAPGDVVNLEFDVIAKYLNRWRELGLAL